MLHLCDGKMTFQTAKPLTQNSCKFPAWNLLRVIRIRACGNYPKNLALDDWPPSMPGSSWMQYISLRTLFSCLPRMVVCEINGTNEEMQAATFGMCEVVLQRPRLRVQCGMFWVVKVLGDALCSTHADKVKNSQEPERCMQGEQQSFKR